MSERSLSIWRIGILLAAVAGVLSTAALGRWQLARADEKQALTDQRLSKAAMAPVQWSELGRAGEGIENRQALLHRSVLLKGHWEAEKTVYLDNRQMQGRAGFYVVTPLVLNGGGVAILVQRGWVPRSFTDRQSLPKVTAPDAEVALQAHLAPWPSRMYDFAGVERGPIRQNLDLHDFRSGGVWRCWSGRLPGASCRAWRGKNPTGGGTCQRPEGYMPKPPRPQSEGSPKRCSETEEP